MTTCSNRQQQYLNLQKRHHFLIHFFRILILVVFLILWEWTSQSGEYSCAATPQIRQTGNRLSGLAETAYASLLAQCFV